MDLDGGEEDGGVEAVVEVDVGDDVLRQAFCSVLDIVQFDVISLNRYNGRRKRKERKGNQM